MYLVKDEKHRMKLCVIKATDHKGQLSVDTSGRLEMRVGKPRCSHKRCEGGQNLCWSGIVKTVREQERESLGRWNRDVWRITGIKWQNTTHDRSRWKGLLKSILYHDLKRLHCRTIEIANTDTAYVCVYIHFKMWTLRARVCPAMHNNKNKEIMYETFLSLPYDS